jgi:hypothetical protein
MVLLEYGTLLVRQVRSVFDVKFKKVYSRNFPVYSKIDNQGNKNKNFNPDAVILKECQLVSCFFFSKALFFYFLAIQWRGCFLCQLLSTVHSLIIWDQWFWRPDVWHKIWKGYENLNLFIKKHHFTKYFVVAAFWTS